MCFILFSKKNNGSINYKNKGFQTNIQNFEISVSTSLYQAVISLVSTNGIVQWTMSKVRFCWITSQLISDGTAFLYVPLSANLYACLPAPPFQFTVSYMKMTFTAPSLRPWMFLWSAVKVILILGRGDVVAHCLVQSFSSPYFQSVIIIST